jgi:hypothetical protein
MLSQYLPFCNSTYFSLFSVAVTEYLRLSNLKEKEVYFGSWFWKSRSMALVSAQLLVKVICCSMHGGETEWQSGAYRRSQWSERKQKKPRKPNLLCNNPLLRLPSTL